MTIQVVFFEQRLSSEKTLLGACQALSVAIAQKDVIALPGLRIFRFEIEVDDLDILSWLGQQRASVKLYWSARDEMNELAGLGIAHEVKGIDISRSSQLQGFFDALRESKTNIRYLGGARFDPGREFAGAWQNFDGFRFVLAQVEISRRSAGCVLACHLAIDQAQSWESSKQEMLDILGTIILRPTTKLPFGGVFLENHVLSQHQPSFENWDLAVNSVLNDIGDNRLKKVVLAQKKTLVLAQSIDVIALMKQLKQVVPRAYHFCFSFGSACTFLGASPEQLYARDLLRIHSEAQAGTRPRGLNEVEDNKHERELLASPKDYLEHELVRQEVENVLQNLCRDYGIRDDRRVVKLHNVQHLRSCLSGILRDSVSDVEILNALHPTPAVCGLPRASAIEKIRAYESFDRGYYAGPVGYFGAMRSEFAVGIRSALVEDELLHIFAGAGIVAGSNTRDEWQEVANKMALFTR